MELTVCQSVDITTGLIFVFTFLLVFYSTKRRSGVPPGPPLFPVIGNLPHLASGDLFKNLDALRKQYGDIYGVYIGKDLNIFLNGHKVIHDALIKKGTAFLGRPRRFYDKFVDIHYGIVFAEGQTWKEQRRFILASLQELCYKNSGLPNERIINDEISNVVEALRNTDGPVDLEEFINVSILNAMLRFLLGHRYEFGDENARAILATIHEMAMDHLKEQVLASCLPFPLDLLCVRIIGISKRTQVLSLIQPLLDKIKHSEDRYSGNCFVSLFLRRMDENKHTDTKDSFNETQLLYTTFDLIVAGSETTANTVRWILLYLIRKPEVQENMYREICKVIGSETASMSDSEKMPYTQAVILEGLRIQSVAPLALPHSVYEDTSFHGYVFPKNCRVMINITSASHDPDVWPEPTEFRPERFLNKDRTRIEVPKEFIPFSLGPRACLGETFARVELFLYVTTLVQRFKFLPEVDGQMPPLDGHLGVTWSPNRFRARTEKR